MTTNTMSVKCDRCGSFMKQVGAEGQTVLYHCSACGANATVSVAADGNTELIAGKTELLVRVSTGIAAWETTQWDYLKRDLLDFMARYPDVKSDFRMQMALLATITHGFHYVTEETYKECKTVYKLTDKLYKCMVRAMGDVPDPGAVESSEEYKKNRALYKKCVNDYRNTKLAWKLAFSVVKKLVPFK